MAENIFFNEYSKNGEQFVLGVEGRKWKIAKTYY